ncbi:MAG: hypothetical protein N3B21_06980 [Clostridia bacterium]|nr:hypothetical protein [Clostridia bacterium]
MQNVYSNESKEHKDVVIAVYNHYQALALNEHNLINQRMTHFFLGNTFLFSGFIASYSIGNDNLFLPEMAKIRVWLPVISIMLSIVYALFFIIPSITALKSWSAKLEEIEESYFDKLGLGICLPYKARERFKKTSSWPLYIGFPLQFAFFVVLWGMCLNINSVL